MTEKRKKQAIDGKRLNAFAVAPEDLTIVGIDTNDGPEHPLWQVRVKTLKRTITAEWVKNILNLGVLETITVRRNGPLYEVVAGRRRTLGAREANKILVDSGAQPMAVTVKVVKATDTVAMDTMVAENEGRVDDSPIVRAQTAARYFSLGRTHEEIAVIMCLSGAPQVKNLLRLLDLSDTVQKHVDERRLSLTTALTLRDLTRAEQDEKAAEFIAKGVPAVEAKRQTRLRKAAKPKEGEEDAGEGEVRGKRPSIALLRKLEEDTTFLGTLSEDARHLLHWCAGNEASAKRIKGFAAKLKELGQ